MQIKDPHRLFALNSDDNPAILPDGDVTKAFNVRMGASSEQHGVGNLETLQGEISLLIAPDSSLLYYGGEIGGSFVYPGYSEVQIGTQVWMKKNWDAEYPGSKVYDNNEDNAAIYGRLYTHGMVMSTGFVPDGWRVPTEADINILLTHLGGAMLAGGKMKEVGDSHWTDPNTGADDSSGFRAVPGGKFDVLFDLLGDNCLLWLQDDGEPTAPTALNGSEITAVAFVANWLAVAGVTGYYLDVSLSSVFASFVAGYEDLDVGNVLFKEVTGLAPETPYFFRVRAYNEVGTSISSNIQSLATLAGSDWFLPSLDELHEMHTNLKAEGVGGFSNSRYWSSSEFELEPSAWGISFSSGLPSESDNKSIDGAYVRACRSFIADVGAYSLRDVGPAAGLIFYIDGAGTTYYEAAPSDHGASSIWSNIETLIGTTGTAIGTGQANTAAIIGQVGHTDSAAKLCDDLT